MISALLKGLIVVVLISCSNCIFDVTQYGAVPFTDNIQAHFKNQKAFKDAITAANSSEIDRVVRIPSKTYYSLPTRVENIHNVIIEISGRWAASKSVKMWPFNNDPLSKPLFEDFIHIKGGQNLTIRGGGKIDGRGFHWWMLAIVVRKQILPWQGARPHLIRIEKFTNLSIHDLILKNSAQFHLKLDECYDVELYNLNILVNTTAQLDLLKRFPVSEGIATFPLNTDGIDPHGARMHIYNLTIHNFDDAVVPKPGRMGDLGANCTEDILVQNISLEYSIGMAIGSISPSSRISCIRNITFRNVYLSHPLKAIYIKTNPGTTGKGLVEDIFYSNFTIIHPIWYSIWIGPQQMKQMDGDGPGCMLYPYDPKGTCKTNPLITIHRIYLKDISVHRSLAMPIVIKCNQTNPCTDINFDGVRIDSWILGKGKVGYVCEHASGSIRDSTPELVCLKNQGIQQKIGRKEDHIRRDFDAQSLSADGGVSQEWILKELEAVVGQHPYREEDDEFDYNFESLLEQAKESKSFLLQ